MDRLPVLMILADGSRRWAKKNSKSIKYGYEMSAKILASFYDHLYGKVSALYISVCTYNNLVNRPPEQIPWYLDAFFSAINMASCPINLEVVGDLSVVSESYRQLFRDFEKRYNAVLGMKLFYAVGWSSDTEMLRLCQKSALNPPKNMSDMVAMSDIKEPIDFIIRSGKVQRLSGMIPIFSPYAEIYFIDEYFPDMTIDMLDGALRNLSSRERRFGGSS